MLRAESFRSREEDVTKCPSRLGEGREGLVGWGSSCVVEIGLLFQDCFGYAGSFVFFHTDFKIICSVSVKNTIGILIGIALNP